MERVSPRPFLPPRHWLLKARVGTSPQEFLGSAGHERLTLEGTSGNSHYSPPLTCGDAEALGKWGFWRSSETFPRPAPRIHLVPSTLLGSEDREGFRCLYSITPMLSGPLGLIPFFFFIITITTVIINSSWTLTTAKLVLQYFARIISFSA